MAKANLTAERLRELLHYDPETGVFTRLAPSGTAKPGDIAGSKNSPGYRILSVDGISYLAHRLAWLYMTGKWPEDQIDHKDRDRQNNRWWNLREATPRQNKQNHEKYSTNTSGYLGVGWHKLANKWRARIVVDWKEKHLGLFDTPEEAHAAYMEAKRTFHPFGVDQS